MSDSETITGIAWYRRNQWSRLHELAADTDRLEEAYDGWLAGAQKTKKVPEKVRDTLR